MLNNRVLIESHLFLSSEDKCTNGHQKFIKYQKMTYKGVYILTLQNIGPTAGVDASTQPAPFSR